MNLRTSLIGALLAILTPALAPHASGACINQRDQPIERAAGTKDISHDGVEQAFDLRMRGKVDDSVARLDEILAADSDNADALYELARARFHMALGTPQELMDRLDEAQQAADHAARLSNKPEHLVMAALVTYFKGYIEYETKGASAARENIERAFEGFSRALELNPELHTARLYLVELLAHLPRAAGGNKSEAKRHARILEGADPVYGAKARYVVGPQNASKVKFWSKVLEEHRTDADVTAEVNAELGKAYLYEEDFGAAMDCFVKAVEMDSRHSVHILDLARFHAGAAMGQRDEPERLAESIESGRGAIDRYLQTEPSVPMRAYATRVQSMLASLGGDQEGSARLHNEAVALDPYVSKMSGTPQPELFAPAADCASQHRYMLRHF